MVVLEHRNKQTGVDVHTPHKSGKNIPGGIRLTTPNEMPSGPTPASTPAPVSTVTPAPTPTPAPTAIPESSSTTTPQQNHIFVTKRNKSKKVETLKWLISWFKSNCDGDWEHDNQIQIYTVDNPGWVLKVGLLNTPLENVEIKYKLYEKSENDWYGISLKNGVFDAAGDIEKLEFLLFKFKEIIVEYWK